MFNSIDVKKHMEYMEEIKDIKISQIDAGYPWGTISKEEAEYSYDQLLAVREEEIDKVTEKNASIPESVYNKYFENYEKFLERRREQELKHRVHFNTEEKNGKN